ncbi:MAG: type II secretion system protein GspN, partial [Deltaproteobacteria bacterium]|nr:type II secretion system protein GspN [Deltaproteobacteria bacterium]
MKLVRFIGYLLLFVVSFVFFLYWSFPYDMLKDRLITAIEQQLGGDVAVSIDTFEPYYFTGVALEKLSLRLHEGEKITPILTVDEAYGRFSVFSLLFGRPRLKATIESGKGRIRLVVRRGSETDDVDLDLDDVNLGSFGLLEARSGIKLTSRIDGEISLRLDRQRMLRTTGNT